ncbi:uncharacterized protein [Rhodnius prolixus]|uniref:uncharacterized protein n=1 Tax=Rhodnius prolixus TaxID=13249 RepID=UPI003D188E0E
MAEDNDGKDVPSASAKVSLGKNLEIEEETLTYFPQKLGTINLEEELEKLQEKYHEKTKGEDVMLYNYQNYGVNYPININYRTTAMEYGFFPPNEATIPKKYFPKMNTFTKNNPGGMKKGTSGSMNL